MRHKWFGRSTGALAVLVVLALGSVQPAHTASPVTEVWVQRYKGPANSMDQATALAVDGTGNVYVTGYTQGNGTGDDFTTVKYNSSGIQLWAQRYDSPANNTDRPTALAVDGSSNVYVTGRSRGNGTDDDYATVKYDSSGVQMWVQRYSDPADNVDEATALAVDKSGSVYVTGRSYVNGTGSDYATVKYGVNGDQKWVRHYRGFEDGADGATAAAVDDSGNVYVTGHSLGNGTGDDYATVKYDADGVQKWVQRYNGFETGGDRATALKVDGAGNVYVTGSSEGNGSRADAATVKYDNNGVQQWIVRYSGPADSQDWANDIEVDGTGNVFITGFSGNAQAGDFATVKYDVNGNQQWEQRYNALGNAFNSAAALALDGSGNVYVTGYSQGNGTRTDYTTLKYDGKGGRQWVQRYNGTSNDYDQAVALALDGLGNVYVTGSTWVDSASEYATIKYSQALTDTTPPIGVVGNVVTHSPSRVYVPIMVTDGHSGVSQVKLTERSTNCKLKWDSPNGTVTAPIKTSVAIIPAATATLVRVVKLNAAQQAHVELQMWDAAGNTAFVDLMIGDL